MSVGSSSWTFQSALSAGSSKDLAQQARETAVGGCMSTTRPIISLRISSTARARWVIVVVLAATSRRL